MSGRIITINRLYGSNGRRLGKALSERLGIRFYDSELLKLASERKGIPYEELVKVDEKRASMWRYPVEDEYQMSPQYRSEPVNDVLFDAEEEIIRELAEKEDCIIVGRCANYILRDKENCRSVFVYAPLEKRIKTIAKRASTDERNARSLIRRMDKQRKCYYEFYTDEKWTDMSQYTICVDSSRIPEEELVSLLKDLYKGIK